MYGHTVKHFSRLLTLMCVVALTTGLGTATASGNPPSNTSALHTLFSHNLNLSPASCYSETHVIQGRHRDGSVDSRFTGHLMYRICRHTHVSGSTQAMYMKHTLRLREAASLRLPCALHAGGVQSEEIGTQRDAKLLMCTFNHSAHADADIIEGPGYGSFRWWYNDYDGNSGYFDDNLSCPFPEGCDISGDAPGSSGIGYNEVILYWQLPAVFYDAYCN